MCRFEDEERTIQTFDLTQHYPKLEETIRNLLGGTVEIDKLEALSVAPYITERFLQAMSQKKSLHVKLVFHGTMTANFSNIQKRGFLVPGRSGLPVVNGNAYGSGIYLSTCPKMSLSYVRDHPKLLVCAILEGDSKVTHHGVIRVAKDPAYVLPCYILHYRGKAPRNSTTYQRVMSNPYFHNFLYCLLTLFKFLLICICFSFILYIISGSCLAYHWMMSSPENSLCSTTFEVIGNLYLDIIIAIGYGIYYIIVWPIWCIFVFALAIGGWVLSLISWTVFWCFYYTLVLFFTLVNKTIITVLFLLGATIILYTFRKYICFSSRSYKRRYKTY
jgi:hypothetical protein